MRRLRPGQPQLVVTGETDHIAIGIEVAARRKTLLKPVQAQKLDIQGGIGVTDMRIVATGALYLAIFQRHRGPAARCTIADMGFQRGIAQFSVGVRQRTIVGK